VTHHEADLLDRHSYGDTPVHRLDPRAKILATLIFVITVVSYPKYEVAALTPFALFPLLMIVLGEVPAGLIMKRTLIVSPFALMIGLFNPLLDRQTMTVIGGLEISGGWLSFSSIMIRFLLSVTAVLALIATTSFPNVCRGLTRMGVPRALVTQLLFLYRYLFLLVEEGTRVRRARDLRAGGGSSRSLRLAAQVIGGLFIRTMDRAERIYQSMVIRGFDGEMKMIGRLSFSTRDLSFLLGVVTGCVFLRLFPVARLIGDAVRGWI